MHHDALSLKNVHFAVEEIECLTRFLPAIVKTCKDVSVEHSNFTVDDLRIFVNLQIEMSHFRLLDSAKDEATDKLNGDLLQIVGRQFNEIDRNSSFGAEIDHVSPESVCDFLKSWLRASNPFFFNLSVFNCDMVWMTRFMECCFQADLQHQYFEFASKTHSSAHVKVCFSEVNNFIE
ncbi:hypothetical protein WR25_07280 [Diploscapter pachys]|uniref:F-box associated domain-containing protein n=1 Tax=Diploscapter pachys TaxID=2018661 RepID=A0A2A2KXV8_9BILA|nr:hypothetical protein WR25_07280 [Diploscapter pachys]